MAEKREVCPGTGTKTYLANRGGGVVERCTWCTRPCKSDVNGNAYRHLFGYAK
jgi:hypothetical protein